MRRPNRPWPTDRGNNWSALVFSTSWVILKSQSEKTLLSNDTFLLFSPAVLISWDEKLWLYRPSWQHPATPPPAPLSRKLNSFFKKSNVSFSDFCWNRFAFLRQNAWRWCCKEKKKKKKEWWLTFPRGGGKKNPTRFPLKLPMDSLHFCAMMEPLSNSVILHKRLGDVCSSREPCSPSPAVYVSSLVMHLITSTTTEMDK